MTTAQQVIQAAANEIGYKENPPESNHNKFGVWYGMDYEPWCAMFLSYCLYNSGLPLKITTPKGFAYCPYGVSWFKSKSWWHTTPQAGDLVFYSWNGDGVANHVGIVEKINSDGSIVAIEGNTSLGNNSNGGQVMRRKDRNASSILGYGRPNYSSSGVVTPVLPHPLWPGRYITLTSPNVEGSDVLMWQRQMIHRGWTLGSGGTTGKGDDSVFSQNDHEALIKFQEQKGLEIDGKIGPQSWNAAWELPITDD
jgi:peptidoglycan hydrolase-like protein with peptidoglycan-binding domain